MSKERIARLLPAWLLLAFFVVPVLVAQAAAGDTVLLSRASGVDGAAADGDSGLNVAISNSGRFIAFESSADNLSGGDDGAVQNVFLRDTQNNTTRLVSRASGLAGVGGNGDSGSPAISPGGRYVAFESSADNLSGQDNDAVQNVFVRDTQTAATTLVSRASGPAGTAASADSRNPSVSDTGAVSFDSAANNLSAEDATGTRDVFLRDVQASTTTLVSRVSGTTGAGGDADSYDSSVSQDGTRVAFTSEANNLSTADNDAVTNVYVYLVTSRFVVAASQANGRPGAGADAASSEPAISADGRCVSFTSYAENLDPNKPPTPFSDIFVRDIQANTNTYASRAPGETGAPGDGNSFGSSINFFLFSNGDTPSCNQRSVAFRSEADNLSSDDIATFDVFVRDMFYFVTQLASRANGELGAGSNGSALGSAMSPEGGFVAFVSEGDNLTGADNDLFKNVFLRALVTGPPPPPPPPPDLGGNGHGDHGGGSGDAGGDHGVSGHSGENSGGHSGGQPGEHASGPSGAHDTGDHSDGSSSHKHRTTGPILFATATQDIDRLFVLARLHESGRIIVKGSVRPRAGTSRLYRFKRIVRRIPLHVLRKVRVRLARRPLRAVKRALRRGERLRARVTVIADYKSGKRTTATRNIRLRP
jgi:hypothetical protein